MKDEDKTREELIREVRELRRLLDMLKKLEAELREAYETSRKLGERFSAIFHNSLDVLIIIDSEESRILSVNPATRRILGYEEQDLLGKPFSVLFPQDEDAAKNLTRDTLVCNGVVSSQRFFRSDGSICFMDLTAVLIRWEEGRDAIVITLRDITERKQFEEQIAYMALHDPLTDLPNRNFFLERMEQAIALASRYQKKVAIMYVDLDRFKAINDNLGHKAGDTVLRETAHRLKNCVRASDTVARVGGDEFAVLLYELENFEDAAHIARRIIELSNKPILADGDECVIGASIGISVYPSDGTTVDALLKNADTAMYHAKNSGRNRFLFYRADMAK